MKIAILLGILCFSSLAAGADNTEFFDGRNVRKLIRESGSKTQGLRVVFDPSGSEGSRTVMFDPDTKEGEFCSKLLTLAYLDKSLKVTFKVQHNRQDPISTIIYCGLE